MGRKTLVTLGMFLISHSLSAFEFDGEDQLHAAAHAGATYAITHVSEVVCSKIAGKEHKLACTIAAVALANSINVGRKLYQGSPNDTTSAVISGALGSAVAAAVISFDF